MNRAFIIGAPRSGTTFLYALLCSHPAVMSLPETGFFEHLKPKRLQHVVRDGRLCIDACDLSYPWYSRFANHRVKKCLQSLSESMNGPQKIGSRLLKCSHVDDYLRLLDGLARSRGRSTWIEKTPNHIFFVDDIDRAIPQAKLFTSSETVRTSSRPGCTRQFLIESIWTSGRSAKDCLDRRLLEFCGENSSRVRYAR